MGEELNASGPHDRGLLGDPFAGLVTARPEGGERQEPEEVGHDVRLPGGVHHATGAGEAAATGAVTLPDASASPPTTPAFARFSPARGQTGDAGIAAPPEPSLEEYWPDIAELDHQETVTTRRCRLPRFDLATIHVLTTATISRLRELYPQGRFEARRFRPTSRASRER